MRVLMLLLIVLAAGTGPPAARASQPRVKDDEVERLLRTLIAADNRGDLESVVACYTEDAVLMPPTGPIVRGRTAIRASYQEIFSTSRLEIAMDAEERHVIGDWAFSRGRTSGWVTATADRSRRSVDDKFLMVLRSTPGAGWRIQTLMWSPAGG